MKVVGAQRDSHKSTCNRLMRRLLDRLGGEEIMRGGSVTDDVDLLIQWGFKPTVALQSQIDRGKPYVIADGGYFDGTRASRFSIGINGFHGLSMQPDDITNLPPRFHPPLQPYREGGEFVVVYGQMQGDQALRGVDMTEWMHQMAHECTQIFHKPARKRLHPKMFDRWEAQPPSLDSTFEETFVAVTWTSTAAVQTVIAGVPTVTMHPASPAFRVTPHLLVRETMDRQDWIHKLSYREYALWEDAEVEEAARYILNAYPQALAEARSGLLDRPGLRGE